MSSNLQILPVTLHQIDSETLSISHRASLCRIRQAPNIFLCGYMKYFPTAFKLKIYIDWQICTAMYTSTKPRAITIIYLLCLSNNCCGALQSQQLFVNNILATMNKELNCQTPTFLTIGYVI